MIKSFMRYTGRKMELHIACDLNIAISGGKD